MGIRMLSRIHAVVFSRGAAESRRERPVTISSASETTHPTATAQVPIQVSFLCVSASPRELVPAFNRMVVAEEDGLRRASPSPTRSLP